MAQPAAPSITVQGNVAGSIVVGDNNVVVNTNYGTIINQQAAPQVRRRSAVPQPPRKPRGFVGRTQELTQIEGWIASGEPGFLCGTAGLGKTSLAKRAANSAAARSQPDGVIFLQGVDQQGAALGFADLLQLTFDSAYETQPQLKVDLAVARTYLSSLRPLVLLSGFTLSGADLDSLADLFPSAPILIEAESAPSSDAFTALGLGPLAREDAIALLKEQVALEPSAATVPLAEIATLLNDTPAALVAIGNAIREKRLTAEEALMRLKDIAPEAATPVEAGEERAYRVVLATLGSDERDMLLQTGAAPGVSVDRKWLEKICGGKPVSEALEALGVLQANSPRLGVMPGFRGWIGIGAPNFDAARSAARARLLERLLAELSRNWEDFDFVRDELGNLLGLLHWSVEQGHWSDALKLVHGLDPFLTLRGLWDGWGKALTAAQEAASALDDQTEIAWVLHQMGTREIGLGELVSAGTHLGEAHRLRLSLGDETGAAYSQHNLEILGRLMPPPRRSGDGRLPWIAGGIAVIILLLITFGIVRGLHSSLGVPRRPASTLTSVPVTSTRAPTATLTLTATFTLTATATPTPTPSTTVTETPTGAATPTPTFVPLLRGVMREHAYCFYGPGRIYLYFYGLSRGVTVEATGRNEDGSWIYVQFPGVKEGTTWRCWFAAGSLALESDPLSLQPVYPDIVGPPISGNPAGYPHLKNVGAVRNGDNVTISWDPYLIPLGDREGESSPLYLLEVWVCRNGQLVFAPHGLNDPSFTVTDEPGCAEPSHGRVWMSEKHGYIGPEEIDWPLAVSEVESPSAIASASATP